MNNELDVKVFKINGCDWIAAKNEDEAKKWYLEQTGISDDDIDEVVEVIDIHKNFFYCEEDTPDNVISTSWFELLKDAQSENDNPFPCFLICIEP